MSLQKGIKMFNKLSWSKTLSEKEIQKCFDNIEKLNYKNVKVLRDAQIVIVNKFHLHFSEYQNVKVVNVEDETYTEELNSFESVLKSIYILSL